MIGRGARRLYNHGHHQAVLKQIVGQRAGVNIRQFHQEMPEKQQEYMDKLRFAKTTKNLMIFEDRKSVV